MCMVGKLCSSTGSLQRVIVQFLVITQNGIILYVFRDESTYTMSFNKIFTIKILTFLSFAVYLYNILRIPEKQLHSEKS